jgi:integrase
VFFRTGGEPIISLLKAFKRACKKAGCPGRTPHDLRRSAVRQFVRAGLPDVVSMRLIGHKTRAVFDRYNIVSNDDLRHAAEALDAAAGSRSGQQAPAESGK